MQMTHKKNACQKLEMLLAESRTVKMLNKKIRKMLYKNKDTLVASRSMASKIAGCLKTLNNLKKKLIKCYTLILIQV